ncbi:carboxylesterase family protein [Phenylobacterium sp.]|uniref:carboxylesterase/lipase family protein n=1 Tax=Phenylobacterium sp. TaxID=1871053 RepID=UPI00281206EF|nr:carboxylesterase family protein [Phenylobacterium sp.]
MTRGFDRRFVLGAGAAMLAGPAWSQQPAPVVETAAGRVRGSSAGGVLVFRGIPYGESTAGPNRFLPPKKKAAWTCVRDCLVYGPTAPQMNVSTLRPGQAPGPRLPSPIGGGSPTPEPPVGEDCLVLNVWTPSTTGKRAVLFWMHGGGFSTGSGSSLWYDGSNIARKQDVVIVTVNHRLNVLGFCDLSGLGERYAHSGHAGMLDCVLALQWVRENIERFGGDPDRVLIHGESGGGRKTSTMMAFTPAAGLFHRAVVQSGSQLRLDSQALAREKAARLLKALEIAPGDAGKLQDVPVGDLVRAGAKAAAGLGQWRPQVDGHYLPRHPFEPDAPAISRHVPMMIGTNRTEQSVFLGGDPAMDTLTEDGLRKLAAAWVPPERASDTVAMYRRLHPQKSLAELAYMITTDRSYFLDSTLQAERKAKQGGAPAYYYAFYRETPVQGGRYFAPHAEEIPFVFDTLANAERMVGPVTPEAQALADKMSAAWANFAKSGRPSAPGLPAWPAYDTKARATMVFDTTCRIENDPRGAERKWMAQFGSQQDRQSELPAAGHAGGDTPG